MAVQQMHKSRARVGMRRSHDALTAKALSTDSKTGELHLRHHISPKGVYKGRQVIAQKSEQADEE